MKKVFHTVLLLLSVIHMHVVAGIIKLAGRILKDYPEAINEICAAADVQVNKYNKYCEFYFSTY